MFSMKKLPLLLVLLAACGPVTKTVPRGDVTPSRDSLFAPLDVTVSASLAKDPEIERFVAARGMPSHVDLEKASFSPPVVKLYYLQDRKVWEAYKEEKGWKLIGPSPVSATILKELGGVPTRVEEEVLEAFGEQEKTQVEPQIIPEPPKKETVEQVVKRLGNEEAQLTPKGDVVHIVASTGERYEDVAQWYTYDKENAVKIARMNGGSKEERLQISDQVVVPKYLLKHTKRLPSEAIEALRKAEAQ